MKYYRAEVTREQTTYVYFSAPDNASKRQLHEFAEKAAANVDSIYWQHDFYDATAHVEISEEEASKYLLDFESKNEVGVSAESV